jgi:hypothetical protein
VSEDVDEAPYVYGYLCDLIESNHPTILGPNNSNLARIVGIFAEAFSVDALPPTHEVHSRCQSNKTVFSSVTDSSLIR